jgi:hypothetical protein
LAYIEKKGLRVINYDSERPFLPQGYQVTVEERRLKEISSKQYWIGQGEKVVTWFEMSADCDCLTITLNRKLNL